MGEKIMAEYLKLEKIKRLYFKYAYIIDDFHYMILLYKKIPS